MERNSLELNLFLLGIQALLVLRSYIWHDWQFAVILTFGWLIVVWRIYTDEFGVSAKNRAKGFAILAVLGIAVALSLWIIPETWPDNRGWNLFCTAIFEAIAIDHWLIYPKRKSRKEQDQISDPASAQ